MSRNYSEKYQTRSVYLSLKETSLTFQLSRGRGRVQASITLIGISYENEILPNSS